MQRYDNFPYLQNFQAKNCAFSRFFLENNCIFLDLYINCNLHFAKWYVKSGLLCASICFLYLCTVAVSKTTFADVFYNVVGARTLYIRDTTKSVLFAVCGLFIDYYIQSICFSVWVSLQPLSCSICMLVLSFVFWYVCSRIFSASGFTRFCSTKFVRETLCKFMNIYAKQNVYLCNIMINRKLWGIFEFSLHLCANVLSFYFLFSRFSSCIDISVSNKTRNEKSEFLQFLRKYVPFCRK